MAKPKMTMKSKKSKVTGGIEKMLKCERTEENNNIENNAKISIKNNKNIAHEKLTMDFVKSDFTKLDSPVKPNSSNPELEKIWNELNTDREQEMSEYNISINCSNNDLEKNKQVFEDTDQNAHKSFNDGSFNDGSFNNGSFNNGSFDNELFDNIVDGNSKSKYSDLEIVKIVSIENKKILTDKIKDLQKAEWIEVFRIVKNNETKHYQENNSGIWIVMNKLKDETIIKLHQFVEYSLNNKHKLEIDKIQRNRIREQIRSGKVKNDEDFIKDSQLLKNMVTDEHPSGYSNSFNGITHIGADTDSNLRMEIDADENILTSHQLDDLVSKRLMARMKEDVEFSDSKLH